MGFRCGIVGLPNVGKSTLFNALTETAAAQAANYPFCTIEPNVGRVAVPDARLDPIARDREVGAGSRNPDRVRRYRRTGARRVQGRGPRQPVPANIREVDAIVHVLRCFEDGDMTHVEGQVDPIADAETVETELMLADLDSLERRVPNLVKKAQQGDKEAKVEASVLGQALELLRESKPARLVEPKDAEEARRCSARSCSPPSRCSTSATSTKAMPRPAMRCRKRVFDKAAAEGAKAVVISAAIEAEIATLPADERDAFLADLGLHETGLNRMIHAAYELLGLITFYTAGPKESRAWTVHCGRQGARGRGRDPHRFRARLHPRRDDRL